MDFPIRKPTRLQNYDYSQNGCYFVTVCVQDRKRILSKIPIEIQKKPDFVGANCVRPIPTQIGKIVEAEIQRLDSVYPNVFVEAYIIMPNHIHLLLLFDDFACGRTQFALRYPALSSSLKGKLPNKSDFPFGKKASTTALSVTKRNIYAHRATLNTTP